ncbi:hypothetical protein bmyco0002_23880 [Bacillus pseudomycoides]|nr:hypothetical protein bmyco0002_23880 [Bacillus pseudomycoides]
MPLHIIIDLLVLGQLPVFKGKVNFIVSCNSILRMKNVA